jgi:glutathione S-transferase
LKGDGSYPIMGMLNDRSYRAFAPVERRLGDVSHCAGNEFTAADTMMFFPLSTLRAFRAYLRRIGERPGEPRHGEA